MKNIILLFLLTVCCSYCNSTKPVKGGNRTYSNNYILSKNNGSELNGNWELKSLWGMEDSKIGKAFIKMDFNNKTFTGNAGCNDISGTFGMKDDLLIINKNIIFSNNECPKYNDKKFISMLMRINKYEIHDDVLELTQDNIVLMTFRRAG